MIISLGELDQIFNTNPLRYAISCYVEKIFGYIHDDYDYSNVNRFIEANLKKFIKNVSCSPSNLTQEDFDILSSTFNKEEIFHLMMLVVSIKNRIQLTYLSESVNEIIKNII